MFDSSPLLSIAAGACRCAYERMHGHSGQFDHWPKWRGYERPLDHSCVREASRFDGLDLDVEGAFADASLFICSPHSCEVVKTRCFSRSFGVVNLKIGSPRYEMAKPEARRRVPNRQAHRSHDLCGRLSVGSGRLGRIRRGACPDPRCPTSSARSGVVLIIGGRL